MKTAYMLLTKSSPDDVPGFKYSFKAQQSLPLYQKYLITLPEFVGLLSQSENAKYIQMQPLLDL